MTTASIDTQDLLNKVPEVTFAFWVIKIMATTVGETAADFLNDNLGLGLSNTSYLMATLLLMALAIQFWTKKYTPWAYWLSVVLISVVGTLISDNLVDNLGVSLQATTTAFSLALAATFIAWYAVENTLSVHTIFSVRREFFYWLAILFTFALGTSAGDLVAEQLQVGYLSAAVIFGSMIGIVTLAYYVLKLNAIPAFWIAYVLTRPFGASCGDLLSQPTAQGGLGLGATETSTLFLAAILALVIYQTVAQRKSH